MSRDTTGWVYHIFTPTAHPLNALALALTGPGSVMPAAILSDDLAADPRSLQFFLARQAAEANAPHEHLLLVVDQFEEVFTLCQCEEERAAFIAALLYAVSGGHEPPDGRLRLVIALRADFYGHCAAYADLRRTLETCQQYIGGMSPSELRRCIEGPLELGRWEAEPGLVDLLVRDAGSEPGALPLLSHALLETWRVRSGRMLTLEGYATTGGVQGAIARTADAVYGQLDGDEQAAARRIFLRLTALGDGMQETRRRVARAELLRDSDGAAIVESVLQTLAAARLITVGAGQIGSWQPSTSEPDAGDLGNDQVEMAHEALIREWPVLRQWLAEDREGLRLHRRLTEAAGAWETSQRNAADLYRGIRLAQAEDWAKGHPSEINPIERDFIIASQAEADRIVAEREAQQKREVDAARQWAAAERARAEEQQRNNRELRRRAWLLAAALAVVLVTTALAMVMWRQAGQAAKAAQAGEALALARELAASADANLTVDHQRAILLALEAVQTARASGIAVPAEAEAALHRAIQASPLDASIEMSGTTALNADGLLAATGTAAGRISVWSLPQLRKAGQEGAQPRYAIDGGTQVFDLSPDDRLLAVADAAGHITLRDASTGVSQRVLPGHKGGVTALRFAGDGSRLVSAGADGAARTWDTATGHELAPLVRPSADPRHVDISRDGSRILADVFDGGVYLWDPVAGSRVLYVIGHQGEPWAIAFCGGPDRFVVGSGRAVRLWDATSGQHLRTIDVADSRPASVACSPDGLRLAVSAAATTRLWDIETGQQLAALATDSGAWRISFSADAARLLIQQENGHAKMWDLQGSREMVTLGTGRGSSDVGLQPRWLVRLRQALARPALSQHGKFLSSAIDLGDARTGCGCRATTSPATRTL